MSPGGQVVSQGRNSIQIGDQLGSLKSRFGALFAFFCVFLGTGILGCILLGPTMQNVMILGWPTSITYGKYEGKLMFSLF